MIRQSQDFSLPHMATHGSTALKTVKTQVGQGEERENSRIRMCRNADQSQQVGPATNMNLNLQMLQSEQIQKSPGNRSQQMLNERQRARLIRDHVKSMEGESLAVNSYNAKPLLSVRLKP